MRAPTTSSITAINNVVIPPAWAARAERKEIEIINRRSPIRDIKIATLKETTPKTDNRISSAGNTPAPKSGENLAILRLISCLGVLLCFKIIRLDMVVAMILAAHKESAVPTITKSA